MSRRAKSLTIALAMALMMAVASAPGVAANAGPSAVGVPVTYVDEAGVEQGTVTVDQVLDPFTGYPEDQPPDAGTKFVLVVLSYEGTGDEGIEAYTGGVFLHDTTGATWGYGFPKVPDDFAQPELSNTTVGAGSRISGYIGYVVPEDRVIDGVLVSAVVGGSVLLIPADLGLPTPKVGDTVAMTDQGGAAVDATVDSFVDPYQKFAKKGPPAKGARYVLASVALENAGDAPFAVERTGFLLRDANGYLWGPTDIEYAKKPKVKDIKSVSLAKGNRVTGLLGYQVPKDVALDGIYYQGRSGLFRLLDLSAGTPATGTSTAPTCDEMTTWWAAVNPLLGRLVALPPFQAGAAPMDQAASEQMLTDIQSIRGDLLEVLTPDSLVDIQRRTLGGLLLYERSAEDQVTAARDGDADALALSGQAFDAAQLVVKDALAALTAAGLDDC
jgi:hypothetical protein